MRTVIVASGCSDPNAPATDDIIGSNVVDPTMETRPSTDAAPQAVKTTAASASSERAG